METSGVALIALVCVVFSSQKKISGAEVEMRVRRGDDVTLYSDCVRKSGFNPVWFRNCSHQNQPRFMISNTDLMNEAFTHYSFVFNESTNTFDLLIKNVTESDEGLYYCAIHETQVTETNGVIIRNNVYHYGNRSTRLSLLEESCPSVTVSPTPPIPCGTQWKLVLSVCVVCVFISSLFSSICVYCLCTNTTKGTKEVEKGSDRRSTLRHHEVEEDEVCYASLDIQTLKNKRKTTRKKKVQDPDFSTYSEVRTERSERC
ncbi:uncharacterized protein LOC124381359 isoform X2 [Silurus meridionalis]|uniref:uncharacterized protein LOC124381359 isoform X2 n=1 Tax=Silurus meridionalis TaxID=175797 RepID=UPI001EEC40C3|nr:uncharacterized protein LOC124381359 isoform X2 [Silurus meridionalis]